MAKDLFGKCGCNCGQCPAFIKNARTDEDRQRCSDGWHKVLGVRLRPEIIHCNSCQSTKPREKGDILPDQGCYIRPCAIFLGIDSCAKCYAYPCEDLQARMPGEDFRELTEARIGERLTDEEYHSFVEPYEALKNLKKIRFSLSDEDIIEKTEVPPIKATIVDFPDDLPFSKNRIKAFKTVHNLLSNIISPRGDTYARQLRLKRIRRHALGMLWVMGAYGDLSRDGSELTVEGQKQGTTKECGWLVRKRDITLFDTVEFCMRVLKDSGLRHKFETSKKNWTFTLYFTKKAGGGNTLKAFKSYVDRLIDEYGQPEYAGASRFKGKAFTLFKKADMRVLAGS